MDEGVCVYVNHDGAMSALTYAKSHTYKVVENLNKTIVSFMTLLKKKHSYLRIITVFQRTVSLIPTFSLSRFVYLENNPARCHNKIFYP